MQQGLVAVGVPDKGDQVLIELFIEGNHENHKPREVKLPAVTLLACRFLETQNLL